MLQNEIVVLQLKIPSHLLSIEFMQFPEVFEIFVIYPDFELFSGIQ